MTVHVFTSAAANYLPKVRALFASVRRVRPDWRLTLALADDPTADASAARADEVLTLDTLGIPEWRAWTFSHSLVELATGVKPLALRRLLRRPSCEAVIYLDPDVVVFSDLADVLAAFENADVLLTPHLASPERTVRGMIAHEVCTAQHGVFNLGFAGVAARPQGHAFADWWAERCYHFCREDVGNGLYTDQRWIDFAPAYFDRTRVLRSTALNVGPWNLSARRLEGDLERGFAVDGAPLGFFHFSGIDGAPQALAGQPAAAELAAWYARETAAKSAPWGLATFADGAPILPEQRWVYRLRGDLQRAYPDPYRSGPGAFQAWWRGQALVEFPALFDPRTAEAERRRLAGALTTGYAPLEF